MKTTVELTRAQIIGYALLAVVFGIVLTFTGQWLFAQTIASEPDGTRVVAGTDNHYDGSPGDLAYECAPGYTAVQVALGETNNEATGATFTLDELRDETGDQVSVTFTANLSNTLALPSVIVNTAAHVKLPNLYGNNKLAPKIDAMGTTTQTLMTAAYARNYAPQASPTWCSAPSRSTKGKIYGPVAIRHGEPHKRRLTTDPECLTLKH